MFPKALCPKGLSTERLESLPTGWMLYETLDGRYTFENVDTEE